MRKSKVLILLGFCTLLLPAAASAGNGTGACWLAGGFQDLLAGLDPDGKFQFAACSDGFTEAECTSIDELTEFAPGATCDDVAAQGEITWDGSCQDDLDPLGSVCIFMWTDLGETATQALCEYDLGGVWSDDPICGAPVPAMPGFGMAFMALLMLSGALILLTIRGSVHSA